MVDALLFAVEVEPNARRDIDRIIRKQVSDLPRGLRGSVDTTEPQTIRALLTGALEKMNPSARSRLLYAYVPTFDAPRPSLLHRLVYKVTHDGRDHDGPRTWIAFAAEERRRGPVTLTPEELREWTGSAGPSRKK